MKTQRADLTASIIVLVLLAAILLAAALPTLTDTEIRKRIAQVKSDLETIGTALEAFKVDNAVYPDDMEFGWPWFPTYSLTTPIKYVSPDRFVDPFMSEPPQQAGRKAHKYDTMYRYINYPANNPDKPWKVLPIGHGREKMTKDQYLGGMRKYGLWRLSSVGPDGYNSYDNGRKDVSDTGPGFDWFANAMIYDPTNGMISCGDILRCQKTGEVTSIAAP
jgi:type II secretory pathway pseudopilin PulG